MSESEGQRSESPLLSERGATTISGTVVSSLAGMAAQEVEGVHMGGGGSRTASGVLGSITGSESRTSGISVEVGRTETAIDLKMGIEYNKNILQTVEEVRRRITDRVEGLTGLRIKELNATITDITFPEEEQRRRLGSGEPTSERDDGSTEESDTASEARTVPESETTEVEPTSRTHTEGESGPVPEEEVSVEGRPLEEGETTEVRTGDTQTREQPTDEAPEADTPAETSEEAQARAEGETSEREDAEARRRRRAEERARRRRSRNQDG
jgi:uncharacterized alkaline shock family protein YloU